MDLDDLLRGYFSTSDLSQVTAEVHAVGLERMRVDFGLERDRGRRFALWSLLYMLGSAPDLETAFKSEEDRSAARSLMDLLATAETQSSESRT